MRQVVDDLLGDPVAEVLLVLVRAHVGECQDRDRRRGPSRGERIGRRADADSLLERPQVHQHLGHPGVAIGRPLGQSPLDNTLQRTGHIGIQQCRRLRQLVQDVVDQSCRVVTLER